jgi:hypothetical protein
MEYRRNDWYRENGGCRCCTLFLHFSPFDLFNANDAAKNVPIASRNSVNIVYEINIE